MSAPHILHLITGLGQGGAEGALTRLVTADATHRHTVISLMDEGVQGAPLQAAGVQVRCLGLPRGRVTPGGLRRLHGHIAELRPDVVQTWLYHADLLGGLAGRAAGVPAVVWNLRNMDLGADRTAWTTRLVAWLCARLSRQLPDAIVSCSQQALEAHAAIGYDRARMVVIPNGYDMARLAPDAATRARLRAEWGVAAGTCLVGLVGRWDAIKGHDVLLDALAGLSRLTAIPWQAVLVGPGVDADNAVLGSWIAARGLAAQVHCLGARDDVPAVMAALDVHVLASDGEAFPNVLAEAMACGTPCVTTDVGDAALIVGETGWVVPPRAPEALAEALAAAVAAWRDGEGWPQRQAQARARIAERFALPAVVAQYGALWRAVAARGIA
ncbi:MAG: glycosyltransferase [Candidatus Sericytochromatia bacterium]|nr:glycosyltransferase [Candidatus Sericytochromatia bacterium]